jgi:hypothetical protein
MMERAGSREALALAARHLALRFIRQRQQGKHWGGSKQQDQRETDCPAHPIRGLPEPVHPVSKYTTPSALRRELALHSRDQYIS